MCGREQEAEGEVGVGALRGAGRCGCGVPKGGAGSKRAWVGRADEVSTLGGGVMVHGKSCAGGGRERGLQRGFITVCGRW